ncbi:MAG: DUF2183 domain-containing protein [Propionibacteriaceae bacterium]|jgi:phosphatidate phosphatase APP1|nr:DUF2183 domain-containing protein [Propionibacteriaceae bacterium]
MSTRPFFAARLEEVYDRRVEALLRALGWQEFVIAYAGYGSSRFIRVLGRVVLRRTHSKKGFDKAFDEFAKRRGFRNFVNVPCVHAPIQVKAAGRTFHCVTDRGGYIDFRIANPGLAPGWHRIRVASGEAEATAAVNVIDDAQEFGVISDIDDTIIATYLPRLMLAAWTSFIRDEYARQAIPGMAKLLNTLTAVGGGAPIFYVSTGAWNEHPFLTRFMVRHRYPIGPTLLTDWGPTNTGWFRSGTAHKAAALLQLAHDFPGIRWVLVGDNGQYDPATYSDFIRQDPERVRAVAIRQLSETEQVLAHFSTTTLESANVDTEIPWVEAPDGRGLLRQLRPLLGL